MRAWWRRTWSGRYQVQLVDLSTRQSLFAIAWLMTVLLLVGAAPAADEHPAAYALLVVGALVVGAASTWALRDVSRLHPALGPVPRRSTLVLVGSVAANRRLSRTVTPLTFALLMLGGLLASQALIAGYGAAASSGSLGEDAREKYEQQAGGSVGLLLGGLAVSTLAARDARLIPLVWVAAVAPGLVGAWLLLQAQGVRRRVRVGDPLGAA